MALLFTVLLVLLSLSIFSVYVNFEKVKTRYHEIEPNLDNYSAGEILSLSFEKARVALLHKDIDDYKLKLNILQSKIKILKSRSSLVDSFYYNKDFLNHIEVLEKQFDNLRRLTLEHENDSSKYKILLNYMDDMDITVVKLIEIIYKIQISNFTEVKEIINKNANSAQVFSIFSVFLGFVMILISIADVIYLRELLRRKNIFISTIYHELATSMQTICISSDILVNEISEKDLKEEAQRIIYHSNKITEQTREILDYSRFELGILKSHKSLFSVSDLISEVCQSFSVINDNLFLVKKTNCNVKVNMDKYKVYRIIMNLLDNANKNTRKGNIRLMLKVSNNLLIIKVSDNGSGFCKNDLDGLFKAFNQGVKQNTRQGLGLGLTIVKAYTKLLKGMIRAKSEISKGSSFSIFLPLDSDKK
ncbi:HAMP domain-containing histidine kinase (plasmid) [Enterobacter sp. JBIWA003]|uniref:sensor histidine kinase n=1 Tax=Enterobacter sp. JBIWA003 TaxID=2831890 RepID=UPI001CBB8EEF|nr:HAMP domain-containing sensor histidine kinase [Enterobacter sp. JBIWA003]UAN24942.1 HAMP domain-containing histidine kinase [Enterobacter sp. JBIWA003]